MADAQLIGEWIAIVVLCMFSGLFSGLNLGLMGLDPVDLEVVMSGSEPNRSYAKKIKPVRDCGNWLLCTLLLGNVAVNAALSILLADKTDKVFGFLASTLIIVIFGEIIPQAVCSRYALLIGAYTVNIVYVLMLMFSVLAYPIAIILDKVLGQEIGMFYSRAELRKLIDIHAQNAATEVKLGTADIMKGALDLQETKVGDVMTKIDDVFWLRDDAKLDFDVLTQIFKSGHSRIPIMRQANERLHIVGVLYSKDLILLDPDDEISVTHFMNAFRYKKPMFIPASTTLDRCLKLFTRSRTHLCMVRETNASDNEDPHAPRIGNTEQLQQDNDLGVLDAYLQPHRYSADAHANNRYAADENPVIIGVITLEDVIEHALQTQIVDEHDAFVDHKHLQQTNRLQQVDWAMLNMFDHRQKMLTSLPPQELQAVYHFLGQSVRVFMPKHRNCSESSIKNLLLSSSVVKVDVIETRASNASDSVKRNERDPYKDIEANGLLLYERDKKTEYFTLILDGKCEIYAGRQGFRSTLSRWTYLCPDALEAAEQCVLSGKPHLDYVPDFTCKVIESARVLRIRLSDFQGCLQGKFDGFNQFPSRGVSEPIISKHHSKPVGEVAAEADNRRRSVPLDEDSSLSNSPMPPFAYRKNENRV